VNLLRNLGKRRQLVTAPPTATVFETVRIMTASRVGAIPIIENGRMIGIFSERDLMQRVVAPELDPRKTFVSEVMTGEVIRAKLDDRIDDCLDRMKRAGCRHLPVEENGQVVAMIAMRDLLRGEIAEQGDEIRFLRAYLHQTPPGD
jgi:CBS domain-containing protein